jgi:hypothetical protein
MVAVEVVMTAESIELLGFNPEQYAKALIQKADKAWIVELTRSLNRLVGSDFDRVLAVWNLNQTEAARLFDVSRQAISKWRKHGVPKDNLEAVANLSAATDLLIRYLKRDRIPAVVRRKAEGLGGKSLLDLVSDGRTHDVLEACREMFDFGDAHA